MEAIPNSGGGLEVREGHAGPVCAGLIGFPFTAEHGDGGLGGLSVPDPDVLASKGGFLLLAAAEGVAPVAALFPKLEKALVPESALIKSGRDPAFPVAFYEDVKEGGGEADAGEIQGPFRMGEGVLKAAPVEVEKENAAPFFPRGGGLQFHVLVTEVTVLETGVVHGSDGVRNVLEEAD